MKGVFQTTELKIANIPIGFVSEPNSGKSKYFPIQSVFTDHSHLFAMDLGSFLLANAQSIGTGNKTF